MDRLWLFIERACLVFGTTIGAATLYFTAGVYYNWNQQPVPSSPPVIAGNAAMIPGWWIMASGGIGALLLVTAWIMIIIRLRRQHELQPESTQTMPSFPATTSTVSEPAGPSTLRPTINRDYGATAPAHTPKKVFVNVSPSYLIGLYQNMTQVQGDEFAAAYIGKWMRVAGRVNDIFGQPTALFAQIFDNDEKFISAAFSAEESEKVSNIARGETITVQGELAYADDRHIKLVKCDLARIGRD
jgi:hypothetical protein